MAIRTLSESLDNLYTTTWQHMKSNVADQVFDAAPLWFWMRDKGKLKTMAGGRHISEPLEYDDNEQISWITRGGTVQLNDYEFLTVSKWDWKYVVASMVRFGIDDQQNRGKMQIINLMNAKFNNTQNSLVSTMETRLFSAAATGSEMEGLQILVPDDPTAAVSVGDIDQSVYTWWQSKATNMTTESFATFGVDRMRTMLNNVGNNRKGDMADIIVTGQTPFEWYEDELLDYYRITNNKLGDAGFMNQQFKGLPMVWSPSCANTRMYFLNTDYLYLVYDPAMWFDMTEWKPIPEQVNDRAAQIISAVAFTTSKRRCQGVIYNIDTA